MTLTWADIETKFIIRLDKCRDRFIPLNGRGGKIYKEPGRFWAWVPTNRPLYRLGSLQAKVPGLQADKIGDGELTVIFPIPDLPAAKHLLRASKSLIPQRRK